METHSQTRLDSPNASSTDKWEFAEDFAAVSVILVVSLVVAMLITPADPLSMLIACVPIFGLALASYLFGVRAGWKRAQRS